MTDHDLMLQVPCAYCGAGSGDLCVTRSGFDSYYLHMARRSPINTAWGRGYTDCWNRWKASLG